MPEGPDCDPRWFGKLLLKDDDFCLGAGSTPNVEILEHKENPRECLLRIQMYQRWLGPEHKVKWDEGLRKRALYSLGFFCFHYLGAKAYEMETAALEETFNKLPLQEWKLPKGKGGGKGAEKGGKGAEKGGNGGKLRYAVGGKGLRQ